MILGITWLRGNYRDRTTDDNEGVLVIFTRALGRCPLGTSTIDLIDTGPTNDHL